MAAEAGLLCGGSVGLHCEEPDPCGAGEGERIQQRL